ncbi:hypothetical protein ACQJBY_064553 [Aegilops geniculata]
MATDAQVRGVSPMVAASSTGISAGWGCRRGAALSSGLRRAGCGATDDDGRRDALIRARVLNPVLFRPDPRCSSPARWPVTRGTTAAQDHGRSSSHGSGARGPVGFGCRWLDAGVEGVRHHGGSSRARKQTATTTLRPAGAPSPRSMVVVTTVGSNATVVGSILYRTCSQYKEKEIFLPNAIVTLHIIGIVDVDTNWMCSRVVPSAAISR